MSKKHFWRPTLTSLESVTSAIQRAYQVRIYPSRKHPGITMLKIQDRYGETTGQLLDGEIAGLITVLQPFTVTPDKKATIYSRDARISVQRYLEYAITAVQESGWQPAFTRESTPTWRTALALHDDHQPVTPESISLAEEIRAIMRDPEPSDYGRKLAGLLVGDTIHLADLPILASAVIAIDRRRNREALARVSQHVGTPGEPYQADFLMVSSRRWVTTRYSDVMLYKLRDANNNQFTLWWEEGLPALPDHFSGQIQIVEHTQYMGVRETVIKIPAPVTPVELCPVCGGRYDLDQCTCILEPEDYTFTPDIYDIEIEG